MSWNGAVLHHRHTERKPRASACLSYRILSKKKEKDSTIQEHLPSRDHDHPKKWRGKRRGTDGTRGRGEEEQEER